MVAVTTTTIRNLEKGESQMWFDEREEEKKLRMKFPPDRRFTNKSLAIGMQDPFPQCLPPHIGPT